MNIRLENLHAEPSSSNYVSFLAQTQLPKIKSYDTDSIHSVTSVRSLMSSMSAMLSNISFAGNVEHKQAKQAAAAREDIRYLYSAFTKIPCLKISVDHRLKPIAGFEEFPFDTAVPVTIFKNLTAFEIADIDFRSVFGWDVLAETLQSLTVKRGSIDDLSELLHDVVLDDADQRRHRSSKIPSSPGLPLATPLSASKHLGWPGSTSPVRSPIIPRPNSSDEGQDTPPSDRRGKKPNRSVSPQRTPHARKGSVYTRPQITGRRSSGSSQSSSRVHTPRQSSTSLLLQTRLPATKWRFLRHLSVPDSGLTSISSESLLPLTDTLQSLDLSSNLFSEIPDALSSLVGLRALNLSNCLIDSIRSLTRSPLPAVTVLNLRANKLSSLAGIEKLKSLQRLDVRENWLTDPTEAARLTVMPDFYDIYVKRNPFAKTHPKYRVTIFNLFRMTPGYVEDIKVDGLSPDRSERRQLADRVPVPAQATVVEPVQAPELTDELQAAAAKDHSNLRNPADAPPEESTAPEITTRASRRKGPKRRAVEVNDAAKKPRDDSDAELPATTSMVTKEDQQLFHKEANRPNVAESPTMQQEPGSTSPSQSKIHGAIETAEYRQRPTLQRGLSQSSELYRQRIEALKCDNGEALRKAFDSPKLRRDPSISPLMKHQASTGVFPPIKTASIASIHI